MKIKIAINGLGRIGRSFLKLALEKPEIEVLAVNDLADEQILAYLLKFDSVYGRYGKNIRVLEQEGKKYLEIEGRKILSLTEKEPRNLPWKDLGIDIVVEATGVFTEYSQAALHLEAGAKRVIITAPGKGEGGKQVLVGVNDKDFNQDLPPITSNASCTTNAIAPVVTVLSEKLGIKKAILNTVHAYTATQALVDRPDKKDLRRGRAGAQNIVPSTTGAAKATCLSLPALTEKFDGIALRVPVVCGSLADITFVAERPTSVQEVNELLGQAEKEERWQGILKTTRDPLVSSDIIQDPHPSIVDLAFTRVIDGDLVKVMVWYDNEWGYCNALLKHLLKIGQIISQN